MYLLYVADDLTSAFHDSSVIGMRPRRPPGAVLLFPVQLQAFTTFSLRAMSIASYEHLDRIMWEPGGSMNAAHWRLIKDARFQLRNP